MKSVTSGTNRHTLLKFLFIIALKWYIISFRLHCMSCKLGVSNERNIQLSEKEMEYLNRGQKQLDEREEGRGI